jgi:hypothetical protein
MPAHPTAFVSYSWDDNTHKEWVKALATQLRTDGVNVRLDQWDSVPGDQLTHFMETEIRRNDFVVIICTPKYKFKSDTRTGGVGYEGDIMTAEVFTNQNHLKFIPVLARGAWEESAPSWLLGKHYIDLSESIRYDAGYTDLVQTLLGTRPQAPPLGPLPSGYGSSSDLNWIAQNTRERAINFYEYAIGRFSTVVEEEQLNITGLGFLDIVFVVNGRTERQWHNDHRFLEALILAYPRGLSLSYLWRVYQQEAPSMKRYTIGTTYEQLFFQPPQLFYDWGYADFTIFDPDGSFFARKAIIDDVWKNAEESKGQFLDLAFQVPLISEAFVVGSKYAEALGYGSDTNLYF